MDTRWKAFTAARWQAFTNDELAVIWMGISFDNASQWVFGDEETIDAKLFNEITVEANRRGLDHDALQTIWAAAVAA